MKKTQVIIILLYLVAFLSSPNQGIAQKSGEELYYGFSSYKKNVIHGSIAPDIVYVGAHGFYERLFFQRKSFRSAVKIGYGGAFMPWVGFRHGPIIQLGLILGPNRSHFEINGGTIYLIESSTYQSFAPAVSVGYRRQGPKDKIIFRSGIGFPEGIYVSFGYAF
jgi:hypothetical protein